MRLYFIAHTDENGESQDWFIIASGTNEAVKLWHERNGVGEVDPDEGEPDRVFEVPAGVNGPARALGWHEEISQVGGTEP